ncbi:MAG: hypothetical protein GXO39_01965, partial [Thermotogae bacterium]|nr:hypothetical protein [Thermotogota bacterium]
MMRLPRKKEENDPGGTPKTPANGELVAALKIAFREAMGLEEGETFRDVLTEAVREGTKSLASKIDSLGGKIDSLGKDLGSKMDVLINQVRNVRAEMSEITLLKLFVEELRSRGYKVETDPSGVLKNGKIDFVIKARKEGKEVVLYVEVKTAVVAGMVEKIKRKFEEVKGENVEKWLLARFVDSAALEKLAETDIN